MNKSARLKQTYLTVIAGSFLLFVHPLVYAQDQTPPQKAWDTLREGLAEKGADKRATAARVLGLIPKNSKAVHFAEHALEDDKAEVRSAAATALGHIGTKGSIPKLNEALSDKDTSVVLAAARSLLTLKDDSGYESITRS
ncbi:MAG: HEAT repeat domain-containing protein [Candidatus Acidiferrales bacterium]